MDQSKHCIVRTIWQSKCLMPSTRLEASLTTANASSRREFSSSEPEFIRLRNIPGIGVNESSPKQTIYRLHCLVAFSACSILPFTCHGLQLGIRERHHGWLQSIYPRKPRVKPIMFNGSNKVRKMARYMMLDNPTATGGGSPLHDSLLPQRRACHLLLPVFWKPIAQRRSGGAMR